jgi:LysM repeat protein
MYKLILSLSIIAVMTLVACSVGSSNLNPSIQLTPFITPTYTPIATFPVSTSTPLPAPSPTPNFHVVTSGETISAIALLYGVKTADILAANPQVNPNIMSVGTRLLIPPPSSAGPNRTNTTPAPLTAGPLTCISTREGGAQCFLLVKNDQSYPVEDIVARIILGNSQSGQLFDQLSSSPLDILYPGKAMPLTAYFPPPLPASFQADFQMIDALQVMDGTTRYLETKIEDLEIKINPDGLSVTLNGDIVLINSTASSKKVWVAGIAYDASHQVVGVYRWVSANPLLAGQQLPFTLQVYSTGASITDVEVLAQALK